MKFILLIYIAAAWTVVASKHVGCDTNPCQHQCVDTDDSFYCLCFNNYILQPDQQSCLHTQDLDDTYQGCWMDQESSPDLPYHIWSRNQDASVSECVHDCNARGFDFAGMQEGVECWCGNTYQRAYEGNALCTIPCPGSPDQTCGGVSANSIYKVNRDDRYMGCFTEDLTDPDLPHFLWGPTEGRSVGDCITGCAIQGYNFTGVQNGGQCMCGDSYGKHGNTGEDACSVPCYNGYNGGNCGGEAANAVYRVVTGLDLSAKKAIRPYSIENKKATLDLTQLYQYPHILGLYTTRVMIYASDTVNTATDDLACTNTDCYGTCSSIQAPPGLEYTTDVVLRLFYVKLSEIASLIVSPESAERVYVFAQTLYIDQSVDFPWSLYIRARQIIINYDVNPTLTFDENGPEFPVDINDAIISGLESDMTFQKLSLLCAQMLISSSTEGLTRLGWDIVDDMAQDRAYSPEQQHFLDHVRAIRAGFTGLGRSEIHWAPYYTQTYYVNSLDRYHQEITIYYSSFLNLIDAGTSCEVYISNANNLLIIWTSAVVREAELIKASTSDVLEISAELYQGIAANLQGSIDNFLVAAATFEQGIQMVANQMVRQAMLGLVETITRMAFGLYPSGAEEVQRNIQDASDGTVMIDTFHVTIETLTKSIEQIIIFNSLTDTIIETEDFERYIDIVEHVGGLNDVISLWSSFKLQIEEIFTFPNFADISGAIEFKFSSLNLANWEEASTRSMVDYAENMRKFISAGASLANKELILERYTGYVEEVQQDCSRRGPISTRFAEQQYDIMLELNNQLITFCQALYYEEMDDCPLSTVPDFLADVPDLLDRIEDARDEASSYRRTNPGTIFVDIVDEPDAADGCMDLKLCPITMFKQTQQLFFEVPIDHPRFAGLDVFLVDSIEVYAPGAISTDPNFSSVRFEISSSGPFHQYHGLDESTFLTRSLAQLLFQYNLETDAVEFYADLYESSGNLIYHMTPFTTWILNLSPTFPNIDISNVQSVRMVFSGTYSP